MAKMRVAVVGLGVGRRHLQTYAAMPEVEIAAIADTDPGRLAECAAQWGARPYPDTGAMLASEQLDAVSICTPPASHRELTEACASAQVHVLCEKPMASDVPDCEAMAAACRRANVRLMVAQKKRFHPLVARLKGLTDGELGPIRWAVVKYALGRVPMDWFWAEGDGGGPLQENSIHAVDALRYLMGEVRTVMAVGGSLFNPERAPQPDVAAVSLQFENGAVAALGLGQASEWGFADEHFYFACDGGEARFSGRFDVPVHWWMALRRAPDKPIAEDVEPDDCFDREIGHFLDCVRTGAEPLVSGEDAARSVAVTVAIKQSIRTGLPVVLCPTGRAGLR
ncbi:MAG: Gfo/Idh/MocA family oxidoreductase [Armatimonadetes bacterium]|nr:Gfo/Idh/MocA family oxidoreductase [Armatimonadota bacterium]